MTVSVKMKWEKSTMLKGVIESQANEGQSKHNHILAKRIGEWIASHPDDFPVETAPEPPSSEHAGSTGVSIHNDVEAAATEGTPLLGGGKGGMEAVISRPIPIRALLAASNVVTLVLLIWALTRPCEC